MRGFTETATFFPGPDGNALFGVLTTPTGPANGLTLVMLQGGAWIPSMGRNAVSTRIAREQAARGFRAFRFDYHGVGESVGDPPTFRMDNLFVDDLRAAVDWLRTQGCSDFVLMGTCFGARTALAGAPSIPGVRGCALYPPPIRDFAPGQGWVTRPTSWYLSRALRLRVLKGVADQRQAPGVPGGRSSQGPVPDEAGGQAPRSHASTTRDVPLGESRVPPPAAGDWSRRGCPS